MDLYHSIDFTVFFLCIFLVTLIYFIVCPWSWSFIDDLWLLCLCFLLYHWRFCWIWFLLLFWTHIYWICRCLESICLEFLLVLSFCFLYIRQGCCQNCALWFICLIFLLLFDDFTSINLESNLNNTKFTFAVVKKVKRAYVTLSNLCNCL